MRTMTSARLTMLARLKWAFLADRITMTARRLARVT